MKRPQNLLVAVFAVFLGCPDPCGPELCVLTDGEDPSTASCPTEPPRLPKTEESGPLWIRYRVPEGVDVDDPVRFELTTPCGCTAFERKLTARDGDIADSGEECVADGDEILIPLVIPEGGRCSLRISATLQNSSLSVQLLPEDKSTACAELECSTSPTCTPFTVPIVGGGGGGGEGGASP